MLGYLLISLALFALVPLNAEFNAAAPERSGNLFNAASDPARTMPARMIARGDYLWAEKSRHWIDHYRDGAFRTAIANKPNVSMDIIK